MAMNSDHFHTRDKHAAVVDGIANLKQQLGSALGENKKLKQRNDELEAENARLKKEQEGPLLFRIENRRLTPEESKDLRQALEKWNPAIFPEFHEGCQVSRSVLFYALGIAATYQAKYFRLEFQSDRGALVRRKQRQAARLLDKARSGFYMEEETITTAQDALNGRR